jgi:hypothetical protein
MSLIEQQIFIGRCVRATGADLSSILAAALQQTVVFDHNELNELVDLVQSPGFGFTRRVQHS